MKLLVKIIVMLFLLLFQIVSVMVISNKYAAIPSFILSVVIGLLFAFLYRGAWDIIDVIWEDLY